MNTQTPATPKKLLVVDDNEVIVRTIVLKLKSAGYQVFSAHDGAEAVSLFRREKPDLILLDIGFPPELGGVEWDGFRIMEWLHRVDESKKVPIIVITGGAGERDKERALASGALAVLYKPLDHDELVKLVRSTLAAQPQPVKTA